MHPVRRADGIESDDHEAPGASRGQRGKGRGMKLTRSLVVVLALLSSGCATSMQMSTEDLNRLTPTEGIVGGSAQIKGGKDILGRTGGTLLAQRLRGPLTCPVPEGLEYRPNPCSGGAEEVLVARMEAGDYRSSKLSQHGMSAFA